MARFSTHYFVYWISVRECSTSSIHLKCVCMVGKKTIILIRTSLWLIISVLVYRQLHTYCHCICLEKINIFGESFRDLLLIPKHGFSIFFFLAFSCFSMQIVANYHASFSKTWVFFFPLDEELMALAVDTEWKYKAFNLFI